MSLYSILEEMDETLVIHKGINKVWVVTRSRVLYGYIGEVDLCVWRVRAGGRRALRRGGCWKYPNVARCQENVSRFHLFAYRRDFMLSSLLEGNLKLVIHERNQLPVMQRNQV